MSNVLTRKSGTKSRKDAVTLNEHIVEVLSDSGEGAQRCGQSLGAIAAKMGNGIWTVEIIPAEIQPPARSVAGASGVRIRIVEDGMFDAGREEFMNGAKSTAREDQFPTDLGIASTHVFEQFDLLRAVRGKIRMAAF